MSSRVTATYSGDSLYESSDGSVFVWVIAPATVVAKVAPNPVQRLAPIVYTSLVTGVNPGSVNASGGMDYGKVAFFVDGELVPGCTQQPVEPRRQGDVRDAGAPGRRRPRAHDRVQRLRLRRTELGHGGLRRARARSRQLPQTVDFASVTVGAAATRTITLTNSGTPSCTSATPRSRSRARSRHR